MGYFSISKTEPSQVISWCVYHQAEPVQTEEKENESKSLAMPKWDEEFYQVTRTFSFPLFLSCLVELLKTPITLSAPKQSLPLQVDQPTLFEIILAANYLDIKGLLDNGCKTVAGMMKVQFSLSSAKKPSWYMNEK